MSNRFREIVNGAAHFEIGAPLTRTQCEAALESLQAQRVPFLEALTEFDLLAKYPLGEGWRYLTATEEIAEGDEVLCSTGWKPYQIVGGPKAAGTHARRRLPQGCAAGPEYRVLAVGEILQSKDVYLGDAGEWTEVRLVDVQVNIPDIFYRRVAAEPDTGYQMLAVGEVIQQGDEFLDDDWRPARLISGVIDSCRVGRYRRPLGPNHFSSPSFSLQVCL